MEKYNAVFFMLLPILISIKVCDSVDLTLVSGSTGPTVVEACVSKILKSGIFTEDFNFLRNLAYVQTSDGANIAVGDTGGIWKVSSTVFSSMSDGTYDVSSYYARIDSTFSIVWSTVIYDDLNKPLYSALAERLYMAYLESHEWTDEPTNTTIQGFYWAKNISDTEETIGQYEAAVAEIQTGCTEPDRDIVFLIDSSFTNDENYFTNTKSVIANIIRQLRIDGNSRRTVVAVGQFAITLEELLYLNGSATEADVLAAVNSVDGLSNGRFVGLFAREAMVTFFDASNGARGRSTGIPQVLCIFVAGENDGSTGIIETTAASSAVNVIAVGMTSDVTQAQLIDISTSVASERAFLSSNYPSNAALEFAVARQICAETGLLSSEATEISGIVQPNETSSLALTVSQAGMESNLRTSSGTFSLYYSALIEEPSSAYYDYSIDVPRENQDVTLSYTPTSAELNSTGGVNVNLYITLVCTSDIPAEFTITVNDLGINISVTTRTPTPSSSLSDGEIAGIVFSCLIVFCAVLVATVYYRFGKPGRRKPIPTFRDRLDRPMESSEGIVIETDLKKFPKDGVEGTSEFLAESGNAEDQSESDEAQAKQLEMNIRERLHSALRRRDLSDLNDAVEDFMALKLDDYDGDFVKAQRMISVQQCKQGLSYAMQVRNIKVLEKALFKGKRMEYDVELKMELVNAEILLQDLKKIDNLLRRLKRAMDVGDLATIEAVTAELRVLRGCDQSMVDRMLLTFQLREDIEEAMLRRDLNGINESISRILERGLERDMVAELRQAKKMAKDLAVVENARNEVMALKQSRVSEIRSYGTPPPGVHEVMMAVYLLLGYHPTQLQSWTAIQALMGKTGREGLRRMISELELTSVDMMHARMAKPLIENFELRHIKELSEALGVFYVFARSIIKEVEKLLPEGDQDSLMDLWDDGRSGYTMTPFILR